MGRTRDTPRHRRDADTFRCTRVTRAAHVPTVGKTKTHANRESGHLPRCSRTRVTVHQPLHPGASHPVSSNPAHLQPSPAVSSRLQPSQATNQPNDPILGRNQSRTLQKCPERDCCSRWLPIPWGSSLDDVCDAPASQIPAGSAYPTSVHDRYEVTIDRYMVVT